MMAELMTMRMSQDLGLTCADYLFIIKFIKIKTYQSQATRIRKHKKQSKNGGSNTKKSKEASFICVSWE